MSDSPSQDLAAVIDGWDWETLPDNEAAVNVWPCQVCGNVSTVVLTKQEIVRLDAAVDLDPPMVILHAMFHAALPTRDEGVVHLLLDGVHEHCRLLHRH